jgi:ribosomal protein L30E
VNTDKYITGSCTISNGVVCKNEQMVFENPGANLLDFLLSIYQGFKFSYPKFYKMDNLSKLGWLTAEVLLNDTFVKERYKPEETGLILANTNSSLDNDLKYYNTISDIPSPSVFVYTLPNIVIGEICIRNNFKGEHAFFIQDKFDAEFIYSQVNYLLERDILQACICGWIDVLGENYKAALFLIEKNNAGAHVTFSPDNMNRIFNTIN